VRPVTLLLNNQDVASLLTMEMTMDALEEAYLHLTTGEAVCRPRIDVQIPTRDPQRVYQWGTMEGGSSRSGYFAIRVKSDVIYEQEYKGVRTHEKYCVRPGLFCGLILLVNIDNGEPLALINDGYLQHMRVGADAGIGVKYMAREEAGVVGMLGSGGMARSHTEAFCLVRKIRRMKVYSPTKEHREAFAQEIAEKFGIEVRAMDNPRDVHRGVDILAECTDSVQPVIRGRWLEEGTHITSVGAGLDAEAIQRINVSLRLGSAPAPMGLPELGLHDEVITYAARPVGGDEGGASIRRRRAHGIMAEERVIFLADILAGKARGRR